MPTPRMRPRLQQVAERRDSSFVQFMRRFRLWLAVLILIGLGLWSWERWHTWRENSQDPVILAAAYHYRVEPALVKALIWRESRFNPNARGTKGELGLMQIRDGTAADWAKAERRTFTFFHQQMMEPRNNVHCGTWYLQRLLWRYANTDNPIPYALSAYNAGPGNVSRWAQGAAATNSTLFIRQIGYPQTQEYVTSVMQRYRRYRPIFPPPAKR